MKDKWMNLGYEDDELKPYVEPELDFKELKRIGTWLMENQKRFTRVSV